MITTRAPDGANKDNDNEHYDNEDNDNWSMSGSDMPSGLPIICIYQKQEVVDPESMFIMNHTTSDYALESLCITVPSCNPK